MIPPVPNINCIDNVGEHMHQATFIMFHNVFRGHNGLDNIKYATRQSDKDRNSAIHYSASSRIAYCNGPMV